MGYLPRPRAQPSSLPLRYSNLVWPCTGERDLKGPQKHSLIGIFSVIIGLTLGVTDEFNTLFIVIIFHRESIV